MASEVLALPQAHAERKAHWLVFIIVALLISIILFLRLLIVDEFLAFHADMASYLMTRNWVIADDPTGAIPGHFRPPLIGVLLLPFTWAFGDLLGSKILAVLSSILVAFPLYWFAKTLVSPRASLIAALLILGLPFTAIPMVWGYIYLLALAPFLWALGLLIRRTQDQPIPLWQPMLAVFLLVGLNQTFAGIFFFGLLAMLLAWSRWRSLYRYILLTVAPSTLWLPFYIPSVIRDKLVVPTLPLLGFHLDLLFLLYGLFALPLVALSRPCRLLLPMAVLFTVMGQLDSADVAWNNVMNRAPLVLPFLAVVAIGDLLAPKAATLYHSKPLSALITILVLIISQAVWMNTASAEANTLNTLTDSNLQAIQWLRENTPADATILVHPMGLAWYVGGLVPRAWYGTWWTSSPRFYKDQNNAFLCSVGWRIPCDHYQLRDQWGVDYLLIDKTHWQGIKGIPEDGWEIVGGLPWLRHLYSNGGVEIYGWH